MMHASDCLLYTSPCEEPSRFPRADAADGPVADTAAGANRSDALLISFSRRASYYDLVYAGQAQLSAARKCRIELNV